MSRRSAGGSKAGGGINNTGNSSKSGGRNSSFAPPSFPAEQYVEHRQFLIRSLNRNDADLAALVDLNRSLHAVKEAIVHTCGELTLLHLGQGHLELSPDSESLQGKPLPDNGQELCVDFLLRMKLRRKLLNRLARRLNRVAHAMDGNDVAPPAPPKYGDLRLHVDPVHVQAYAEHWKRQEEAIHRIELFREGSLFPDPKSEVEIKAEKPGEVKVEQEASEERPVSDPQLEENACGEARASAADDSALKDQVTGDLKADEAPQMNMEKSNPPEIKSILSSEEKDDPLAADYDALRDYNDPYEKAFDLKTGKFRYTILDQPHEEDYAAIKFGAGIGAVNRSMTAKEKEAEFNQWQTSLLSRIPEQPTFEELGMKNRVFRLEERMKRAAEQAETVSPSKRTKPGGKVLRNRKKKRGSGDDENEDPDGDDDDAMDTGGGDEKQENDEGADDDSEEDEEEGKDEDDDDDDEKEEDDDESEEDKKEDEEVKEEMKKADVPMRLKPISLAAVPSFYDQDLKRIRLIHQELMMSSIQDHARRRLADVTKDYNTALRTSSQLFDRMQNLQKQLLRFGMDNKRYLKGLQDNYHMQYAMAINNWNQNRLNFERTMMDAVLPSRRGQPRTGTERIQRFMRRPDAVSQQVGDVLADVVDAVDLICQGMVRYEPFRDPFVPPPPPDGSSNEPIQATENSLMMELKQVQAQLKASEEERQRAWKKMSKSKAEFEMPHQQEMAMTSIKPDMNLMSHGTLPSLRSGAQSLPKEVAMTQQALPSYIPAQRHVVTQPQSGSDSKYSAARVRERIAADGTVAPVSEPKKTKDGLYQRPAGRTRKGMEWDAVRGIWVPSGLNSE